MALPALLPATMAQVALPDAPTLGQALEHVADLHRGRWYHARQAGGVARDRLRGGPARDLVPRAIAAGTPA